MADETHDHWWWQPGWRVGRSFYTWHVTFGDSSPIGQVVERFAPVLQRIPTMLPVTRKGLRITVQGIGFTDDVARDDLDAIVAATTVRLARLDPLEIQVGPPRVDGETIGLPVADPGPLRAVHAQLQAGIADVWGENRVENRGGTFNPHLPLSYSTGVATFSNLSKIVEDAGLADVVLTDTVTAVSLIDLNRDNKAYEWVDVVRVPLGT